MRKILFLLLALTAISCQKEDLSYTGNVRFSFINTGRTNYDEIHPQIFVIENLDTPLTDILPVNSDGETESIELIYGSYYLSYRSKFAENHYYIKGKVFQVKVNKTTNIIVDFEKD